MRQHAGMSALLSSRAIDLSPRRYLDSVGKVFAVFGPPARDSGNVSYGISTRDGRRS